MFVDVLATWVFGVCSAFLYITRCDGSCFSNARSSGQIVGTKVAIQVLIIVNVAVLFRVAVVAGPETCGYTTEVQRYPQQLRVSLNCG